MNNADFEIEAPAKANKKRATLAVRDGKDARVKMRIALPMASTSVGVRAVFGASNTCTACFAQIIKLP